MDDTRLYLIDATAFCYRAFYALSSLSTSFGQPTNAVYGFMNILNKILKENKPDYLAVCFDVSRETFRQKKFKEYKIKRPPMPEGLSGQIPLIKQIISAYNIAIFEKEGFEADDIIATLNKKAKEKKLPVTIVSSDKDILQLVDDDTVVFSPYKDAGVLYNRNMVFERFNVEPEKIADIIALMGDDIDNIPSVPGIGEKTAVELIKRFGSIDNLLKNLNQIDKERVKNAIMANIERIKLNRELAVLDADINIDFDLNKLKLGKPNFKELFKLFKYLEFKSFLKDLPLQEENSSSMDIKKFKDEELKDFIGQPKELVLYGLNLDDMVFYTKDIIFGLSNVGGNIKELLSDPKVKKISHDLKKIKVSLAKENINLSGLYFDTMLASYLLNPSKATYNPEDIAWDYLEKIQIAKDITNLDALNLILELRQRLENELRQKQLLSLFNDLELPLIEVLADMQLSGIRLDLKVLNTLSQDIEKRLIKLIEDIYDLSGCQFNINSPKQLRDILFEKLKLPIIKRSKTGPSTDEEVLRRLCEKHKLPALLLEYRQLMKLKNTYVDTLPGLVDPETSKIHTTFNQAATETGRLSSSSPNLQNIPIKTDIGSRIRQAIIASPDCYLLSCDYSQIELRVLAHLSKDENLISAFKKDKDIHKTTASLIYGLDEKDINHSMRESAKRINFGIIYGLSAYGLSRDLNIPVEDAQAFIDTYFLRYPKVKIYIQEQIKKAQEEGFVTTILGRRRYIPEIKNKNMNVQQFAQRQAVNTPIQGSASDMIKLAMVSIYNKIKEKKLEAKMVLQIHDELVFDLPTEELKDLSALVKYEMENVLNLEVPIKVDMKKGKNWLQMQPI